MYIILAGAWYGKPAKIDFAYMPTNNGLKRHIIDAGKGKKDLVWMMKQDERHNPYLRSIMGSDLVVSA